MSIAYKSAGAGAGTETSGAALNLPYPASVDSFDILIAHVVHLNNTTTPSTPAGWVLLFGPSGLGTGTPTGRAWCFGKLAAGNEDGTTVSFGTAGGTSGRLGRIYSFSGWVSGTINDVVPAASFAENSSETDPVIQAVTTTVAGAKAVALVSQDDNNSHADLGAVTGGTWAEAVADYLDSAVGAQGAALQIQVGTPTSDPGTISGGTVAGTDDEANTICFEIRPNVPAAAGDGAAAGVATVAAIGIALFLAVGSAAGSSTATAEGTTTANYVEGAGSSAGVGMASATGRATAASAGMSSGTSTASSVGAATSGAEASAAGAGMASAVGASNAASTGSSAGTGTASGTGASTWATAASAAGVATATASGTTAGGTTDAEGSAAGTSAGSAVGTGVRAAVATSTGTGSAAGVGRSTWAASGTSSGTGSVSGVGASTRAASGASAGQGTASGVGVSTAAATATTASIATAAAVSETPWAYGSEVHLSGVSMQGSYTSDAACTSAAGASGVGVRGPVLSGVGMG